MAKVEKTSTDLTNLMQLGQHRVSTNNNRDYFIIKATKTSSGVVFLKDGYTCLKADKAKNSANTFEVKLGINEAGVWVEDLPKHLKRNFATFLKNRCGIKAVELQGIEKKNRAHRSALEAALKPEKKSKKKNQQQNTDTTPMTSAASIPPPPPVPPAPPQTAPGGPLDPFADPLMVANPLATVPSAPPSEEDPLIFGDESHITPGGPSDSLPNEKDDGNEDGLQLELEPENRRATRYGSPEDLKAVTPGAIKEPRRETRYGSPEDLNATPGGPLSHQQSVDPSAPPLNEQKSVELFADMNPSAPLGGPLDMDLSFNDQNNDGANANQPDSVDQMMSTVFNNTRPKPAPITSQQRSLLQTLLSATATELFGGYSDKLEAHYRQRFAEEGIARLEHEHSGSFDEMKSTLNSFVNNPQNKANCLNRLATRLQKAQREESARQQQNAPRHQSMMDVDFDAVFQAEFGDNTAAQEEDNQHSELRILLQDVSRVHFHSPNDSNRFAEKALQKLLSLNVSHQKRMALAKELSVRSVRKNHPLIGLLSSQATG